MTAEIRVANATGSAISHMGVLYLIEQEALSVRLSLQGITWLMASPIGKFRMNVAITKIAKSQRNCRLDPVIFILGV